MNAPLKRSGWRLKGACALGVATVLVVAYLARLYSHPYDEVSIEVRDVPTDATFVCLVADAPGGPVLMLWSLHKVGPFTMHPDACTASDRWGSKTAPHRGSVRWVGGERVGVLLGERSGRWRIAWYDGEARRVRNRSLVLGGGSWRPSLHDATAEQRLDEDALRALGLDRALRHSE